MYSFIVFQYVILIRLKEKIPFRENWLKFLGIWREAELILRSWGAKEKYFQGAEEFSFRDLGRSMHYFQGSKVHRPYPPPGGASTYESQIWCVDTMGIQSVSYCFWVNVTFGLSSRKIMSWSNNLIYLYLRYESHIYLGLHSVAYCFRVTVILLPAHPASFVHKFLFQRVPASPEMQ